MLPCACVTFFDTAGDAILSIVIVGSPNVLLGRFHG